VAAEAGVDTEWVARFAVPILAEQAQVVELARALVYAKPRLGESAQPLGVSVAQNLSDRGIFLPDDVAVAGWSAFQLHDSVWMVRFRYRSRGRDQEAYWEIDVPSGRILARNRHASDLGYVDPNRRRRDVEAVDDDGPDDVAEVPPAPARRAARRRSQVGEPMAKAVADAKRPAAGRARGAGGSRVAPPVRRSTAAAARPAPKAATGAKAGRRSGAAKRTADVTRRTTGAAGPAKAGAAKATKAGVAKGRTVKGGPARAGTARAGATKAGPARRRATKEAPGPDAGPTAGSGGVRMAVAQVSTARVAASMATADREPWAGAVRRPPPAANRSVASVSERRREPPPPRTPAPRPVRAARGGDTMEMPAFEPRPLPAGGEPRPPDRVRRVTVPRPDRPSVADAPPAMSIPAPRRPAPQQEPMPVERPKRRRLRSR
jgi:hypothetical protein